MENIRVPRQFQSSHLFITIMATILVIGMFQHVSLASFPNHLYYSHWPGNEALPTLIDPGATSAFPVSRLAVLCTLRLRYLFNTEKREKKREKELHAFFCLMS